MSINIVYRGTVPIRPYSSTLVCVPTTIIPQVLGALRLKSAPYWYVSSEDHLRAQSAISEFGGNLLMPCAAEIVNAVDRVYNLLDASLNGVGRSVAGDGSELDPFVYSPPLAQAPEPDEFQGPSLRTDVEVQRALLDNLTNGTVSAVAPDARNFRQQLDDLILAVGGEGELDPQILAKLVEIAALLA